MAQVGFAFRQKIDGTVEVVRGGQLERVEGELLMGALVGNGEIPMQSKKGSQLALLVFSDSSDLFQYQAAIALSQA